MKNTLCNWCILMEFPFSSWNFITRYCWTLLRSPFEGSLTRREDKDHILQAKKKLLWHTLWACCLRWWCFSLEGNAFPKILPLIKSFEAYHTQACSGIDLVHLVSLYFQVWKWTTRKQFALCRELLSTQRILLSSKALSMPMCQMCSFTVFAGCILESVRTNHTSEPQWKGRMHCHLVRKLGGACREV